MSSTKGPAEGTRISSSRYYFIRAEGKRRIWLPLTQVKEGLPAFYRALANAKEAPTIADDCMPKMIAAWQDSVMKRHAPKTQKDEIAQCIEIAKSFAAFKAGEVRAPDVADYLRPLMAKPRTHNAHRGMLRELMRYAEERGFREPGSNPVTPLRTMATPARDRYIGDAELAKIKAAALIGDDGRETRSGPMLCALVDMAYLTGQRISDLLTLEWDKITDAGIEFKPAKVKGSTGVRILVQRTEALDAVIKVLRLLRVQRKGFAPQVFTTQDGKAYTYWGASTAWRRAVKRAGIKNCHFHDIRAKALTDKHGDEGMQAANTMGGHSTEAQTGEYVRHKTARKTKATK